MHEEKGVKFIMNASPDEFQSNDDGQLTGVVVNGETVDADVCVVGIGVMASTGFLVRTTGLLFQVKSFKMNYLLST